MRSIEEAGQKVDNLVRAEMASSESGIEYGEALAIVLSDPRNETLKREYHGFTEEPRPRPVAPEPGRCVYRGEVFSTQGIGLVVDNKVRELMQSSGERKYSAAMDEILNSDDDLRRAYAA